METIHTQGKWIFEFNFKNGYRIFTENGTLIATINDSTSEKTANAKLIASAPEMLEALKSTLAIFGRGYEPKEGVEDTIGSQLYLQIQNVIKQSTL